MSGHINSDTATNSSPVIFDAIPAAAREPIPFFID